MEPWSMQPVIILHYSELGTLGKTIGLLVRLGYPIGGRDKKNRLSRSINTAQR
jgi:hypothetical protein